MTALLEQLSVCLKMDLCDVYGIKCTSIILILFAHLHFITQEDVNGSKALYIFSYIGCGISILCLLFSIVVMIAFRYMRSSIAKKIFFFAFRRKKVFNQIQHFVNLNLSLALLVGLILFTSFIETLSEYRVSVYDSYD